MPGNTRGVKNLCIINIGGETQPNQPQNPTGENKGLCWGISKIWGEMLDINSFIDDSSLGYDRVVSMHLFDSKG